MVQKNMFEKLPYHGIVLLNFAFKINTDYELFTPFSIQNSQK